MEKQKIQWHPAFAAAIRIELAKKVFRFAKENMSICEIAEKCGVSEEKVRMILE